MSASAARKERRGEEFDLRHVVGLDDASAQTGAPIRDSPAFLVAGKLAVEQWPSAGVLAALPDQRPTAAACDAFDAGRSAPCRGLRAGRNHESAP